MEAGGLTSLLMLLRSPENETIHRVAAGAIANLAMNGMFCVNYSVDTVKYSHFCLTITSFGLVMIFLIRAPFCVLSETNQELIMAQGGVGLLSMTAAKAEDPQTLRMVAGAIANLCGNGKLPDLFQC